MTALEEFGVYMMPLYLGSVFLFLLLRYSQRKAKPIERQYIPTLNILYNASLKASLFVALVLGFMTVLAPVSFGTLDQSFASILFATFVSTLLVLVGFTAIFCPFIAWILYRRKSTDKAKVLDDLK